MMRSVRSLTMSSLMAALLVILSQVSVPVGVTAVTLQTFAVALAGYMLGAKEGAMAVGVYLLMGACGLPVFSGFAGGIGVLAGPTGGFLLAFPLMALLCGRWRRSMGGALGAGFAGLFVVYIWGTLQMSLTTGLTPWEAFLTGAAPFLLKDAVSLWAAFRAGRSILARIR